MWYHCHRLRQRIFPKNVREKYVDTLVDNRFFVFCESVKPDTLKRRWMTLKHTLVQDFTSPMQTLASDETLSLIYPIFSKLSAVIFSLTCFNCRLRLWFFYHKENRNSSKKQTETLDMLIHILSKGPTITNFDFDHAASVWASI